MWNNLHNFYTSDEWTNLLTVLKMQRVDENGDIICEHCGKPIYKAYDCIGHHKVELTLDNVNDASISLNAENIMLVHHSCHNVIHNRFGSYTRHVYLIYGSPLSGKSSYVKSIANKDDLVIDIDKIRESITGGTLYERSNRCNDNVFAVRDLLLDMVKTNRGKWNNAFVIGGYPYIGERERIANEIGAEVIYIDSTKEECLERLEASRDGRDKVEWTKYIETWWKINNVSS